MMKERFGPMLTYLVLMVVALGSHLPQGLAQEIELEPGEIGGMVTYRELGRAVRKATVKLLRWEAEGCFWKSIEQTTATQGEYRFPRQRPGEYLLRAEGGSVKPANREIELDENHPLRADMQVERRMRSAGGEAGGRLTGRKFLLDADKETEGYGLYSYLIFTGQAEEGGVMEQRYEAALAAYLRVEKVEDLEETEEKDHLNVFYLPANRVPAWIESPELKNECGANRAALLLTDYDYSRAKSLHKRSTGLYIIATPTPLSSLDELPEQRIEMDLSSSDPEFVGRWVELFIEQAEQEKFWETLSREDFLLRAREKIRIGGRAVQTFAGVIVFWSFSGDSGE